MKKIFLISFIIISISLRAQTILTIEGTIINNTEQGNWEGVNISRSERIIFTYRNNTITSVNSSGYMLQAGDEEENERNNKLDGMIITGNQFTWNGIDVRSITHALFTGYNVNSTVKYNYLDKTPHGILFKSGSDNGKNMANTSGGAAYNIIKNARIALRMKGINRVNVYNNTLYNDVFNDLSASLIQIDANHDRSVPAPSLGARIYNNIFYTKYQIPNIRIDSWCLADFESDHNVYYCETGTPVFVISGVLKTFAEWQALGYDTHSVIVNPDFVNSTSLVPAFRLDYGTDLGAEWRAGLSTIATWGSGSPSTTYQNGTWQVGARVLAEENNDRNIKIYPNPAFDEINISINDLNVIIDYIRIINLSGKVVFHNKLDPDDREFIIPINFLQGFYIVQIGSGDLPHFTQKLIVAN